MPNREQKESGDRCIRMSSKLRRQVRMPSLTRERADLVRFYPFSGQRQHRFFKMTLHLHTSTGGYVAVFLPTMWEI